MNVMAKKTLHEMSINELGQLFPIKLEGYSDKWIDLYRAERKRILDSFLPSEVVQIDHIGSTAIPGIKAKPTIDILLQIAEFTAILKVKSCFQYLGYYLNEHPENPAPHLTFVKGYTPEGFKGQAYHVHIRYPGDWDEIRFRDYLIKHKTVAKEYEALKEELAIKYRNDREAYTHAKTVWIEKINELAKK